MDTSSFVLALVVLLVAIVATLGGVIALLKQKVFADEAGHVTEIEIPLLGKFNTVTGIDPASGQAQKSRRGWRA